MAKETANPRPKLTAAHTVFNIEPFAPWNNLRTHTELLEAIVVDRMPEDAKRSIKTLGALKWVPKVVTEIKHKRALCAHIRNIRDFVQDCHDPERKILKVELESNLKIQKSFTLIMGQFDEMVQGFKDFDLSKFGFIIRVPNPTGPSTFSAVPSFMIGGLFVERVQKQIISLLNMVVFEKETTLPLLVLLIAFFSALAHRQLKSQDVDVYNWLDSTMTRALRMEFSDNEHKWQPGYTQMLTKLKAALADCNHLESSQRPQKAYLMLGTKYRIDIADMIVGKALSGSALPRELVVKVVDAWCE